MERERIIRSGAGQRSQVQRVNDNKKVCKWACCCRGVIHNNMRGAGKCGVKCLMDVISGVGYSRFVFRYSFKRMTFIFFFPFLQFCDFQYGELPL